MGNLRRICLTYLATLSLAVLPMACTSNKSEEKSDAFNQLVSNDSIPEVIKNIVIAAYEGNPDMFAAEVGYPLLRPYPLKDIQNMEQMKEYYNVLMDDSLRNVLVNSTPDDWQKFGWRGYSLSDGSYLWVDEAIYSVNYVSKREQALIDSLTTVEINSLPKSIRAGWTPVMTFQLPEKNIIYRIDKSTSSSHNTPDYRLAVYDNPEGLKRLPSQILNGDVEIEGSAAIVSYIFRDGEGNAYMIFPDYPRTGNPVIILPDGSENQLEKAYWYDLVK